MNKSKALLVASLASAMALPALAGDAPKADSGKVKCYGVNKCKGSGDCGGEGGGSCKGTNACKHTSFIEMDKDTCLRLDGGRLTAKAEEKKDEKKMDKK